jgi:SAM-dependent methyltransferase
VLSLALEGGRQVLDVSYEADGNLMTLEDQGWDVSGIEVSEEAAAHARALIGGTIYMGTLESYPFAPNTFDLTLMSHFLEHLPSPADALRCVHALLKDGNVLS